VLTVYGGHCAAGERSHVVLLPDGTKAMLPVWMAEAAAAHDVALTASPHVSIAALEAVRALLDQGPGSGEGDGRP